MLFQFYKRQYEHKVFVKFFQKGWVFHYSKVYLEENFSSRIELDRNCNLIRADSECTSNTLMQIT